MGGWLDAQIKAARKKREQVLDPERVLHSLNMSAKALEELETSGARSSKS